MLHTFPHAEHDYDVDTTASAGVCVRVSTGKTFKVQQSGGRPASTVLTSWDNDLLDVSCDTPRPVVVDLKKAEKSADGTLHRHPDLDEITLHTWDEDEFDDAKNTAAVQVTPTEATLLFSSEQSDRIVRYSRTTGRVLDSRTIRRWGRWDDHHATAAFWVSPTRVCVWTAKKSGYVYDVTTRRTEHFTLPF